jgi:hypothetical protein
LSEVEGHLVEPIHRSESTATSAQAEGGYPRLSTVIVQVHRGDYLLHIAGERVLRHHRGDQTNESNF